MPRYATKSKKKAGKLLNKKKNDKLPISKRKFSFLGKQVVVFPLFTDYLDKLRFIDDKTQEEPIYEGTDTWKTERDLRISSSWFYRVLSWNGYSTSIFSKMQSTSVKIKIEAKERIKERMVLQVIRKNLTFLTVEPGYFRTSSVLPWISATADGIIRLNGQIVAILEVKSSINTWEKASYTSSNQNQLRMRSDYFFQLQTTMFVYNVERAIFVFLHKQQVKFMIINFNHDLFFRAVLVAQRVYVEQLIPYQLTKRHPYRQSKRNGKKVKLSERNSFYFPKNSLREFKKEIEKSESYKRVFLTWEKYHLIFRSFSKQKNKTDLFGLSDSTLKIIPLILRYEIVWNKAIFKTVIDELTVIEEQSKLYIQLYAIPPLLTKKPVFADNNFIKLWLYDKDTLNSDSVKNICLDETADEDESIGYNFWKATRFVS